MGSSGVKKPVKNMNQFVGADDFSSFLLLPERDRNVSEFEDFRRRHFRTGKTHSPFLYGRKEDRSKLDRKEDSLARDSTPDFPYY